MDVKINIYVRQSFKAVLNYNKEGLNVKKKSHVVIFKI